MRHCQECKNENHTLRSKWCSDKCYQRTNTRIKFEKNIRICKHCKIKFVRKKSISYCSKFCMKKFQGQRQNQKKKDEVRIKHGLPLDHPRLIKENGEGHHCTTRGYVVISRKGHLNARNKSGSIYEHVWVLSEFLGRPLRKGESVHHKNGIKDDNRKDNLELWHKGQPAGQRLEDKIKWAKDFLISYKYQVIDP